MFHYKFAQIYQSVAHPAQRGIYTYVRMLGDLLETKAVEIPHQHHFALLIGKEIHKAPHIFLYLGGNKFVFDVVVREFPAVEDVVP